MDWTGSRMELEVSAHEGLRSLHTWRGKCEQHIGLLREHGVHVVIVCVPMKPNIGAFDGVQSPAREVGAEFTIDPTITRLLPACVTRHA